VARRVSKKAWEQLARMVMKYGRRAVAETLQGMDPDKVDLSAYAPKPKKKPGPKPDPVRLAMRQVGWFSRIERARADLTSRGLPDSVQEASRLAAAWLKEPPTLLRLKGTVQADTGEATITEMTLAEREAADGVEAEGLKPKHSTGRKYHRKVRNALGPDDKA
jgi:hypothetical protein